MDASTPDLEYLCKLCDLFGVTADYLIRPEREAMETTPLAHPEPINPPPTPPSSGKQISGIRFTGWVLFILGLVLSQVAILLLLFGLDSTILWFLTGVCIVIGLELFLIRWKPLFIVMWTVWLIWTFIQFVLNSNIYALLSLNWASIFLIFWVAYTGFCIGATVGVIRKHIRAKSAKQ